MKQPISLLVAALTLGTLTLASSLVEAKTTQLQPVKMAVNAGDSVQIKGYKGSVEIISQNQSLEVTVEVVQSVSDQVAAEYKTLLDEWQFHLRREGDVVLIKVEGPATKELWNQTLVSGIAPEFHLKVTMPALATEVNWGEGKFISNNHMASIKVTQNKGDVLVTGGEGDLVISNHEGSVTVRNRKGEVSIESYLAKVELENLQGQVNLENFTGESRVEKIEGALSVRSFRGNTKVARVKGRLEFKNGNSPLHIENFQGELRGKSLQGPVSVEVLGEADVKLETQEGSVNLKLADSGAYVNLGSAEGSLLVPNFLKLTRLPNQQIRTGRLRGSRGGRVFVRTTSGDVRVR